MKSRLPRKLKKRLPKNVALLGDIASLLEEQRLAPLYRAAEEYGRRLNANRRTKDGISMQDGNLER
jgi:hypothetical protein